MSTPVKDWTTDYDIFDPGYIANPFGVWDELRQKCPMAHTERWGWIVAADTLRGRVRHRARRRALLID